MGGIAILRNDSNSSSVSNTSVTLVCSHLGNPHLDWSRDVNFICMGVVINVGVVCNILALLVLLTSVSMRRTSTGSYLIGLTVADTLFLSGELFRWVHSSRSDGGYFDGLSFMNTSVTWCRTIYALRYVGKVWSAWITVAITAERFVTISYPLKVIRVSTATTARIVVGTIGVLSAVLASFPAWTLKIIPYKGCPKCQIGNEAVYNAMNWAILRVGSLMLPGAIILVFTVLIFKHLVQSRSERSTALSEEKFPTAVRRGMSVERQLTSMLLAVAIAFLLLRLPYTIAYYINHYKTDLWTKLDSYTRASLYHANRICDVIATSNYAINFFLYCMCGSMFRRELCALLRCVRCGGKRRKGFSHHTMSSFLASSIRRWSSASSSDRNSHLVQPSSHQSLHCVEYVPRENAHALVTRLISGSTPAVHTHPVESGFWKWHSRQRHSHPSLHSVEYALVNPHRGKHGLKGFSVHSMRKTGSGGSPDGVCYLPHSSSSPQHSHCRCTHSPQSLNSSPKHATSGDLSRKHHSDEHVAKAGTTDRTRCQI